MAQPALNFGRAPRPRRLPEARPRPLLISGRGEIAKQASADGAALNAPTREDQCARLLRYFEAQGYRGATDAEIHRDLRWPVNIVTARRNDLLADGLVAIRWPNARRRSCKTRVKVVVWVAASAVRTKMQLLSLRGRHAADAEHGPTATSIGLSTNDEHEHRTGLSGAGDLRSDRSGGVSRRGESAGREVDDRSAGRATAPRAIATSDAEGQPQAQPTLSREGASAVGFGTRVVLADGHFAQVRMVTRQGDVVIYIFKTREYRTLAPTSLRDHRERDGELVEVRV